jgi:hypothetical protein
MRPSFPIRRRPWRSLVLLLLLVVPTLAVAGCGGGEEPAAQQQPQQEATTPQASPEPTPEPTPEARDQEAQSDDAAGGGEQATGSGGDGAWQTGCERIDRTGRIDMAGQGSVNLSRNGNQLSVSRVRPNDGWRATVDRGDDGDDVEVEFQRGRREVELEAEIDDGRLQVEVCRKRAD